MAKAMASTTRTMQATNQQMDMKQMQAMMQAYDKESSKMEMGTEMSRAVRCAGARNHL